MASIQSTIKIFDGYSPIIKNMIKVNQNIISSFMATEKASGNAFDIRSLKAAQNALAQVETDFDDVERQIKEADEQQKKFTQDIRNGDVASKSLLSTFGKIAATVGAVIGVRKVFDLSDTMTLTTARLNMMNDGLQTTAELQDKIFSSAQRSRAAYQDTADMVAKLGTQAKSAFGSNDEVIAFSELLNKSFKIAGADGQAVESVMYNLTQALSSGVLRGQDLNAVFSNAPNIIQNIADYLDVPIGKIRDMAADGELSASVVKNAMLAAATDINEQFESMPKTMGDVWTSIKNRALKEFTPVLQKVNEMVNSPQFDKGVQRITKALVALAGVALTIFEALGNAAAWVGDNWGVIAPIIMGVVGAYVAYNAVAIITNGINAAVAFGHKVAAAAQAMQTGTTFAATVAQHGLNAALWACPITWIIALIIGLIVVFIIFTEQIVGAIWWLGALFKNIGLWIANVAIGVWNSIKNIGLWFANLGLGIWEVLKACANNVLAAFQNAWINIQIGFNGFVSTILKGVKKIIEWLNLIPGVNISTAGIESSILGYADKMAELEASKHDYQDIGEAWNKGWNTHEIDWGKGWSDGFNTFDTFESGWGSAAYSQGAKIGAGIHDSIMGVFDFFDAPAGDDPYAAGFEWDDLMNGVDDIAGNTAKGAKSLEFAEEDLQYMRDIAERDAINRYTTAEIHIEQNNENHISSNMDLDGVIGYLNDGVEEAVDIATEGGHE
jgi:tape measure domain-containing protein